MTDFSSKHGDEMVQERSADLTDLDRFTAPLDKETFMSPVKRYRLNTKMTETCATSKCSQSFQFNWIHQEQCKLNIMCPTLNDHTCSSHGLSLNNFDICYQDKTYVTSLQDKTELRIWYTDSNFEIDCYFWCQTEQDFDIQQSSIISRNFLETNLENSSVSITSMDSSIETILVSPFRTYNVLNEASCKDQCQVNFEWKRETICQARLTCLNLPHDACGSYIFEMKSIDDSRNKSFSQPICLENVLYESNLNPVGNKITLNINQIGSTANGLDCFFWCTYDGLVPLKPRNPFRKVNGFGSELIDLKSDQVYLSPAKYYHLDIEDSVCPQSFCQHKINLKQIRSSHDYLNIQCSKLGPDVCGSFGLNIESIHEICFKNQTFSFELAKEAILTIWSYQDSKVDIHCTIWTSTHPAKLHIQHDPEKFPLNKTWTESHSISANFQSTVPVSPIKIYEINFKNDSMKCETEFCTRKINLTWHWEEPCEEFFYCHHLSSNVCEDFGIDIGQESICHSQKIYRSTLFDETSIELWWTADGNFDLRCHYWCHNDVAALFWNSSIDTNLLLDIVSSIVKLQKKFLSIHRTIVKMF